jgi:hypothetical protein
MSIEELENGFARLLERIYSPSASERRKEMRRVLRDAARTSGRDASGRSGSSRSAADPSAA